MEPNELPDFLAGIRRTDTYKVPPQYFDTLADDILQKVHLPLETGSPFSEPPAGYFEGLADRILYKIKSAPDSDVQQELEETDPFLARLPRTNPYTVPAGYFESFNVPVEVKKEKAPVVRMSRLPKWITYAAAAAITGIVATGAVLFVSQNDAVPSPEKYKTAMAKVSDGELADYLDNTIPDVDAVPVSNTGILNSNRLYKQLINDASDHDIQQYLNENNESNETSSPGI